jgi:hypothetical protein
VALLTDRDNRNATEVSERGETVSSNGP